MLAEIEPRVRARVQAFVEQVVHSSAVPLDTNNRCVPKSG